jgi:hypothetical protein
MPRAASQRSMGLFHRRVRTWLDAGCSPRAAAALANAGIDRLDQIAPLGKAQFSRLQNVGPTTLGELGQLIGGWPDDDLAPQTAMGCNHLKAAGGDVQLVRYVKHFGLDIQAAHRRVDGYREQSHTYLVLTHAEARALRDRITLMLDARPQRIEPSVIPFRRRRAA